MSRRIIQFSTGNVGVHALRTIIERPDLELVGLHAASPDKIGRDAADLCGLTEPTGVLATDDVDALVAKERERARAGRAAPARPAPPSTTSVHDEATRAVDIGRTASISDVDWDLD